MPFFNQAVQFVKRALTQPLDQMSRAQRTTRTAIDLGRYAWRNFRRDRAPQMSAALTYRTIFSIVPTIILVLLVSKSIFIKSEADVEELIERAETQAFELLRLDEAEIESSPPVDGGQVEEPTPDINAGNGAAEPEAIEALPPRESPREAISRYIRTTIEFSNELSFQKIGAAGLVLLIWAAIALIVTLEQSFNTIYRSPSGRSWIHRIMLYWSMLTLGPILIGVSLYMAEVFSHYASDVPVIGGVFQFFGRFTGFAATWLLFLLLFKFMPNAVVRMRPVLIGALVSAVLWKLWQYGFGVYVRNAIASETGMAKVYGSIGLVPLSLFWVYISWWIALFGLEITYAVQTVNRFQSQLEEAELEKRNIGDPMWLIPVMTTIARAFVNGKTVEAQTIAEELNLPTRAVHEMTGKLRALDLLNMVRETEETEAGFALALPPDQISIARLMEIGKSFAATRNGHAQPGGDILARIDEAQHRAVEGQTLADLVAVTEKESSPGGDTNEN